MQTVRSNPANNYYLFKADSGNTRAKCELCLKLPTAASELSQCKMLRERQNTRNFSVSNFFLNFNLILQRKQIINRLIIR